MPYEEKREEEKSFAPLFAVLALLLIAVSVWVYWEETATLRPWKNYQKDYYDIKRKGVERDVQEAREEFQKPEHQKEYKRIINNLAKEAEEFKQPAKQSEYKIWKKKLQELNKKKSNLQNDLVFARNKLLEKNYQYMRFKKESDGEQIKELQESVMKLEEQQEALSQEKNEIEKKLESLIASKKEYEEKLKQFPYSTRLEELEKVLKGIENPQIEIKQHYLEDLRRVDRCTSCHVGIDNPSQKDYPPPYTTHPAYPVYLQNHPPNQFGCSICHQGQGRATTSVEKAHGKVEFWDKPIFEGEHTQASCLHCHKNIDNLEGAVVLQTGDKLLKNSVCFGCHRIDGYEDITKISPPLSHIGEKVSYSWLVKWLLDPYQLMDGASMPKYNFSEDDARAIADYLYSLRQNRRNDELVKEDIDWNLYDKGKIIYGQSICSICHKANGRGGAHTEMYAPELSRVGSKVKKEWLKKWLQNPQTLFTNSRMSRYRFSDQDIDALSEYLIGEYVDWDMEELKLTESVLIEDSSRTKGATLIKEYGCFGCHDIEGMEDIQEIGPYLKIDEIEERVADELTSFGDKSMEEFDFGKLVDVPRTRLEYLIRKLADPQSFRDDAKMPLYAFSDDESEALVTLILGFSKEEPLVQYRVEKKDNDYEPPGEFGEVVDDIKCLNCHRIFGKGENYAPDLSIEGSKVQSNWLRNYLRTPDIIRPLSEQMPKFNLGKDMQTTMSKLSKNEIDILSDYILAVLVSDEIPKNLFEGEDISASEVERGKKLYLQKGCQACHQIGAEGGAVGPALTSVGSRLTPGYIYKHLLNPKIANKATREPNLGLTEDEALILTKFLISLNLEQ